MPAWLIVPPPSPAPPVMPVTVPTAAPGMATPGMATPGTIERTPVVGSCVISAMQVPSCRRWPMIQGVTVRSTQPWKVVVGLVTSCCADAICAKNAKAA